MWLQMCFVNKIWTAPVSTKHTVEYSSELFTQKPIPSVWRGLANEPISVGCTLSDASVANAPVVSDSMF